MPEPNNSLATASALPLNSTSQSIVDGVSTTDTDDFYRFTLAGRSSLNLTLGGLSGNADLRLLDNAGSVIQSSLNQATLPESINRVLGAGTYYVQVSLGAGSVSANYSLSSQAQNNPYTDIVWRNYAGGQNTIWQVNSSGTLLGNTGISEVTDVNWRIEATGDFNGDGQQDLVWRYAPTGDIRIWTMDGASLVSFSESLGAAADPWQIKGTGDFNGDGQTDLVWRNQSSGQNVVWFFNGLTYTGWTFLTEVSDTSWQLQGVGDFNHDGKSDLVWRNYATGDNLVWFLNGTTLAGITALTNVADRNWQIQGVGDLTGDGQPDLFWRNMGNGQNVIWAMNGTTLTSFYYIDPMTDLNWRATAPLSGFAAPTPIDVAGNALESAFNIGTLNGYGVYQDTVSNTDQDFYTFSLTQAGRVNLGVYGPVEATLVNYGGLIPHSAGGKRLSRVLNPGTYFVQVYAGSLNGYALELNAVPIPSVPSFLQIVSESDSGVSASDQVTKVKTPTITGRAEANATVQVFSGTQPLGQTTANTNGDWQFTTGTLADGNYSLTAKAVSSSGDASAASAALSLTIDSLIPQLTLSTPLQSSQLTAQSRLAGSISGTGSAMATLRYRFDTSPVDVAVALGVNGTFDQLLDLTGLSNGNHTLTITGTDVAGNISVTQVSVVVSEQRILSEGTGFLVQQSTSLNLSQLRGIVSFDLDPQFDRTDQTAITEDRFLVYLVGDPNLPSQTLLGKPGVPGGTVFSLTEKQAEFVPGLVSFDGKTVQIDLSSLTTQTQATLIFQLVNNDADSGTYVKVENITQRAKVADIGSRVDSPVTVAPVAGAITLSTLSPTTNLNIQLSDVRVDALSGRYTARLQVRNTGTVATGRQIAVLFPNLPNGVQLRSPSGLDANGKPYINLRSAIPTQGLAPGASSDLVEISFDNPGLIKFNLQSQAFTGGVNRAPTLQPISPVTLYPGAYSEVPILASDADGDSVIYSIASTGNAPPVTIGNGGKLIFRPTAAQVNQTFNFFVVVSDGVTETRQAVTLSVNPDPVTTTRISGRVQQSGGQPPASLAGIAVSWGTLTTTTSADGSFTLVLPATLPTGTLKVNGKQANIPGVNYSDTIVDVVSRLGHTPYAESNNQLQSIYLTTLDPTHTIRTTDPATGVTKLTNTGISGFTLTIPPGALTDANGNPYTGSISITQPDAARLPATLPEGVSSNSVFSVDLGTANCNAPLPIQAPNPTPYIGLVDLYGLRSDGTFGIVGTGRTRALVV